MRITRHKTLVDSIYYVKIEVTDLTPQERELIELHGEPEVDLGGDFGTFTAPHYYRKFYSDSSHDFHNAEEAKATTWLDAIESRIFAVVDTLKSLDDDWTSTLVHPLWTGTNVRWKDGETDSIAAKIESLIERIEALENPL